MLDKIKAFLNKVQAQAKKAYLSFTIWFNVTGMVILASALAEPMVLEYANSHGFMVVIIVGNVLLRFKTTKGLEDK